MNVTIKGITPSTIAFNTLGIVIRGDSKDLKQYPNSIARHINVTSESQWSEVNSLVNANLIQVVSEDEEQKENEVKDVEKKVEVKPKKRGRPKGSTKSNPKEEKSQKPKKRGRPKGSTNKKNKAPLVKKVNRVKGGGSGSDDLEDESKSYVVTPDGVQSTKGKKSSEFTIGENESTKASLKAMAKLKKEEADELMKYANEEDLKDQEGLDSSDRMGMEAVISTGEGNQEKVALKNSVVPEADSIKKRGVKFIDEDNDVKDNDVKDDDVKDAFIDNNEQDDDEDDFLEI